jgi:hypothetical protein
MKLGDATLTVNRKLTTAPTSPSTNLVVELNPWIMTQGYCGGVWCDIGGSITQALTLLNQHRISPYKSEEAFTLASWQKYVLPYQLGFIYTGAGATATTANGVTTYRAPTHAPVSGLPTQGYGYIRDEPKYYDMTALLGELRAWQVQRPNDLRMVTTPIRHRDLNPASPTFAKIIDHTPEIRDLIQIFSPVAEEFCEETWKGSGDFYPCRDAYTGKKLWLYVSNMSHGSESGPATGAPDLVIDRSAVEAFGFYLLSLKYDLDGLLYYDSIQGWQTPTRDFLTNPYQLGGNGDGLLLYPNRTAKVAYASYRLKLLREASQWADIVRMGGKRLEAQALMTSPLRWQRDLAAFEGVRAQALLNLP